MSEANPFAAPAAEGTVADPATIVIFGASGDLTQRKLVPALFNLHLDGLIDPRNVVLGFARRDLSDEAFRDKMRQGAAQHSRRKPEGSEW